MAVVIRFARHGAANSPFYRLVAADKQYPRDGRYLEKLGTYDPKSKKANLNADRIQYWLAKGAKASDTVGRILSKNGVAKSA